MTMRTQVCHFCLQNMILLYDPGSMFAKDNLLFIVLISKRLEIEQQEDSSKVGCWLRTQVTG